MIVKGMAAMRFCRKGFVVTLLLAAICGCSGERSRQNDAAAVAEDFGRAYFNYDFEQARGYCTAESERWLSFAASNVYEADVEVLRGMEKGAEVVAEAADYADDDSTATVVLNVSGAMQRDTIGRSGRVAASGTYRLSLVKRDGRWLVRMASLPRSGR